MKKLLIILSLLLAIPLLAEQRTKVMVWIPSTGIDSLAAESINKQIRATNGLMGQISSNNSAGTWLGYVTAVDSLLADTTELKRWTYVYPNVIVTIEPEAVLE